MKIFSLLRNQSFLTHPLRHHCCRRLRVFGLWEVSSTGGTSLTLDQLQLYTKTVQLYRPFLFSNLLTRPRKKNNGFGLSLRVSVKTGIKHVDVKTDIRRPVLVRVNGDWCSVYPSYRKVYKSFLFFSPVTLMIFTDVSSVQLDFFRDERYVSPIVFLDSYKTINGPHPPLTFYSIIHSRIWF